MCNLFARYFRRILKIIGDLCKKLESLKENRKLYEWNKIFTFCKCSKRDYKKANNIFTVLENEKHYDYSFF